ncbi:hypothetical protein [Pseudoxanthomonas sp. GM95]|uniref:hypothetical protein n=1 Tax=Pseudoxanthomonas sp. GM95 TaxID=1881043 RepID=UPI000B8252F7|nr:hypothetical protein [Pseudoxanthomonas sp. GM95]
MEYALLFIAVSMNIVASVAVLRLQDASGTQRFLMLVFVWLVPVLGAIICGAFSRAVARQPEPMSQSDGPIGFDGGEFSNSSVDSSDCGSSDGGGSCSD